MYAVYKNPLQTLRHIETESEGMEKYIPCKGEAKESWSSKPHVKVDKVDLKIKKTTRDKEGYYIINKGSVQEEDITVVNMHPTSGQLNT